MSSPITRWYRLVMDPAVNALRALPEAQRFQVMLFLATMWTILFTAAIGAWAWYGATLAAHALLVAGVMFTAWAFRQAGQVSVGRAPVARVAAATYRDVPRRDGSARYDDVWGA
jgi:hypothetical protein